MSPKAIKRKICIITGTRAEYGILFSVIKHIKSSPRLNPYIIAIGMHLMKEFGYTLKEIEKDGFNVYEKIELSYTKDIGESMADFIGRAIVKLTGIFSRLRPDVVIVLGDRGEMLAGAIAANYMNIPVAHIHGGELTGHVDGMVRHAITKLSHIHFPATKMAGKRISKLGEESRRIFVVGAPALDCILSKDITPKKILMQKFNIRKDDPVILMTQHPVLTQINEAEKQIRITLEAVKSLKIQTIVIYPNADAGGRRMIEIIKRYKGLPFIQIFKSIPHKDYLGLLRIASVLVGNSSSGIIEALSFRLPVVNIGRRQDGRERRSNVIDIRHHDKDAIIKAVEKALGKRFKEQFKGCKNPYYRDGHASRHIAKVLSNIELHSDLLQKQITY